MQLNRVSSYLWIYDSLKNEEGKFDRPVEHIAAVALTVLGIIVGVFTYSLGYWAVLLGVKCYRNFWMEKKVNPSDPSSVANLKELEEKIGNAQVAKNDRSILFVGLTSNTGADTAIDLLKKTAGEQKKENTKKKCHIGVAGFFNYEVTIATQAEKLILVDYNSCMIQFHKTVIDLLKSNTDAEKFKEKLKENCQQKFPSNKFYGHFAKSKPIPRQHNQNEINYLSQILDGESSFLTNEKDFEYLHKLASEGNIHVFQADITDNKTIKKIVELTHKEGFFFNTIFVSNVHDWLQSESDKRSFTNNIKEIGKDDNALIIDLVKNSEKKDFLPNIVYCATNPANSKGNLYDPQKLRDSKEKANYYQHTQIQLI